MYSFYKSQRKNSAAFPFFRGRGLLLRAALVMAAVPAIIVYIALQKYSTGGVAAGGVKS